MGNRSVWYFLLMLCILMVLAFVSYQYSRRPQKVATPVPLGENQGTLTGRVTTSTTCPSEGLASDQTCDHLPFAAAVSAIKKSSNEIVAIAKTDLQGMYTLRLPVETYVIRATGYAPLPRCEDQTVHIDNNEKALINITCNSGQH